MNSYDVAYNNYLEICDKLRSEPSEYAKFLKFTSGVYKHGFSDLTLIYRQNPNATKVADLKTWNRLGRRVNKGEHSVVTFNENGRCSYLFDISQTSGRKEPSLWRMDNDLADRVNNKLKAEYGITSESLDEAIARLAADAIKTKYALGEFPEVYDTMSVDEKRIFNRSMLSAARYVITNRCMLNGEVQIDTPLDLNGIQLCKSAEDFRHFGSIIHETAQENLHIIENKVLEAMRDRAREKEMELEQETLDLPFTVGSTFEINDILYAVEEINIIDRDSFQGNVILRDISSGEDRVKDMELTELIMYYSNDQIHEQLVDNALDTILGSAPIIANEPVSVDEMLPPLDEDTIGTILSAEDLRYERNGSVSDFFSGEPDYDRRMEYISGIFHDSGEINVNGKTYGIEKTDSGLTFYEGTADNRIRQSGLSFEAISAKYADMFAEKEISIDIPEPELSFEEIDFTELTEPTRRIQCETPEEAEKLFSSLRADGYTWIDGEELDRTDWVIGAENTYYSLNEDNKTVEVGDVSSLSPEKFRSITIERFSDISSEFVVGNELAQPDEHKYDLVYAVQPRRINVLDINSENRDPIAYITPDRYVSYREDVPDSVKRTIEDYAQTMPPMFVFPEIRKPLQGEPMVTITFSESGYFPKNVTMPFSQANEVFDAAETHYIDSRNNSVTAEYYMGYAKTDFVIEGKMNGEDFTYKGRFDIGDGQETLSRHIQEEYEYTLQLYRENPSDDPATVTVREKTIKEYEELTAYLKKYEVYRPDPIDRAIALIDDYSDREFGEPANFSNLAHVDLAFTTDEETELPIESYADLESFRIVTEYDGHIAREEQYSDLDDMCRNGLDGMTFSDLTYLSDEEKHIDKPEIAKVSDLEVGDIIMYDGARREIEKISDKSISMKNLDAPDYGGFLLGTSDVLAYDGWQQDMEKKGFEIISKGGQQIVDRAEETPVTDKEAYTGLGAEKVSISADNAASMWENGFEVFVDGDAVEPYTHESSFELFRQDRAFSAQFGDVKKQQMIDFISNELEVLDMRISSEEDYFSVRDFIDEEEDDPYEWSDGLNVYLNVTKALIERKFGFIDNYLSALQDDHDNLRAGIAQDALVEYANYSAPFKEYNTVIDVPEYGLSIDLKNIDELYLKNDYSNYEGGIDSDGHERKDNYSSQTESLTITLDPYGNAVVDGYDSYYDYGMSHTEYDLSDENDVSELRNKVSKFIENSEYLSISSKKEDVSQDIELRELTEKEKVFLEKDLAQDIVKQCLAYDEIEDLGYVFFEEEKHPAHSTGLFGNALSGTLAAELRERMDNGEDVSADIGKAVLGRQSESGFYPTDSSWYTEKIVLHHNENDVTAEYNGLKREVSYSAIGRDVLRRAREEYLDIVAYRAFEDNKLPETRFTSLSDEQRMFFDMHKYVPSPETTPWGSPDRVIEINNGIFDVSTPSHGGIMIKDDIAAKVLTKEARDIAFKENGYTCFEEDCAVTVATRELIDKGLFRDIEDYFQTHYGKSYAEKGSSFNDTNDQAARRFYPNYWNARCEEIFKALSEEQQAKIEGQMMFPDTESPAYSEITRDMYHTDDAEVKWLKVKGETIPTLRMDIDASDELFKRLAENGLKKMERSLDRIAVDVAGDNWKTIYIPDPYGNVANNIRAEKVLSPAEMQTFNEVTSEIIERSRNSRELSQDDGQMFLPFDPVPETIEEVVDMKLDAPSIYTGMSAFIGEDNRIYFGKTENLNGRKEYDNSDNSLIYLTDRAAVYELLTVTENGKAHFTQQEALDEKLFTLEDYRELTRLQNGVLSQFEQSYPIMFSGEEFKPVADETIMVQHDKGKAQNYHFDENDVVQGGAKTKYNANIEAIKTLYILEKENRNATSEEQSVLAKYSGWGGIPQAFDDRNEQWKKEYEELKGLLSDSEYKAARSSTNTAFYTPPEVTDAVYQALSQFGFEGGNVLEPSCGVGNFIAKMPESIADSSIIHGVELDSISGRIAQKLYPKADIQVKGFEQTTFPDNSFDVVVGNIPFGDFGVNDRAYNRYNFKIHDYFAAKAIDKAKEGGIVAIVTSKFTMDKKNEDLRRYMAERAELLGAVRLPSGTFKDADGITTDILFFKKKDRPSVEEPSWVHFTQTADGVPCNQYFVDHPEMVLGKMEFDKRMQGKYGEDSKVTVCSPTEGDFREKLTAAIAKIHGSIDTAKTVKQAQKNNPDIIPADPNVRNFTHTLVNGQLYFRENDIMKRTEETGTRLERLMGLHEIRQATFDLINAQVANCSDKELAELQKRLNTVYDRFVKKFGSIQDNANAKVFSIDDDYNTIRALEEFDKKTGQLKKAEIFTQRTITADKEVTHVDSPHEALQVSLDKKGRVDIVYMADLCDKKPNEVITALSGEIYRNPVKVNDEPYSGYEDKSEYLSGNVREKLDAAKAFAADDPQYAVNVTALEQSLPPTIEAQDISASIGVSWVETEDYAKFMDEAMNANMKLHTLRRDLTGEYKIENKRLDNNVYSTQTHGTDRMNSYQIFENLLNKRDIIVKDRVVDDDGKERYVINRKETEKAKQKAEDMKRSFKDWIFKDYDRREKYVTKYNRLFNSIVGRTYDGSHQTFVGMNPAIKLRPHQENAVMRGKLGGNTLLAHCVGAGKSFEIDTIVMEKKRLGLIQKACVVVPKHLTMQTAMEWQRLYPNAKLLVATPKDFEKDKRQEFLAKCVTGDYDGIIMSFEQFGKIPMSRDYQENFIQNQIDTLEEALSDTDSSDRASIKDIERTLKKLRTKLEKLLDRPRDESLTFEQMGFDYVVVDEAHYYKNCLVVSKMHNVSGVQTTSAAKSEDMLMKTQFLRDKFGEGTCLMATGTPLSNSMVELYSMTRYLRPDLLQKAELQTFDDWASNFGEVVSQLEMKPAGDGFQMKKRFAKFVNMPELMQMYKEFADIQMADTLHLPNVPVMATGKPILVKSPADDLQKAYMKYLAERSETIHNGNVDPKTDNMLKITHEARLLGLDSRTINPDWKPDPDCKVMKLCDNLEKIYQDTDKDKGVQIVFCDIAIHDNDGRFSVYKAVKDELIHRGIPENEICFAGDAKSDKQRADMFDELRKGQKRIIIASTSKLGTGANVQDRVAAIHHLDIPWRPADLEQQNGRGLRQGNMFKEVGIYHYVTENTFDAYMLGIITSKSKFISQVMTSKNIARTCEDVDEMVLNYAEMQAVTSGNPLLAKKVQLEYDVSTLRMLAAEHTKKQYEMEELVNRTMPEVIARNTDLLQKAKADLAKYSANKPDSENFSITFGGNAFDERKAAAEYLEKQIMKCVANGSSMKLGSYAGFDMTIEKNPNYGQQMVLGSDVPCYLKLKGELEYSCELKLDNGTGNIARIENLPENAIEKRVVNIENELEKNYTNLTAAQEEIGKPFAQAQELADIERELDRINSELGTDKADDVIGDDEPDEGKSKDGAEIDSADGREQAFGIAKFDISGLQKEKSETLETKSDIQEDKPKPKQRFKL